jgi:LacI family transcriptional regulator
VNVETDDLGASQTLTQHLLQLGHRRIAFLSGPSAAPSSAERLEGYQKALREAGLEVDERLVFSGGATIEAGEKAGLQLLQEHPGATAIQAANDLVAIGAANILLNQGVRIPQDVSIAGFGNVLVSEHFRVPLTTVRQPKLRLGTAAIDCMFKLLSGVQPPSKRLSGEIEIRQSTAPPPEKAVL